MMAAPQTLSLGPGKMPCSTACLEKRFISWNPRSRTRVTPALRLLSMLPAALKAEMGRGSSMDWRARSWMPSQFRWA